MVDRTRYVQLSYELFERIRSFNELRRGILWTRGRLVAVVVVVVIGCQCLVGRNAQRFELDADATHANCVESRQVDVMRRVRIVADLFGRVFLLLGLLGIVFVLYSAERELRGVGLDVKVEIDRRFGRRALELDTRRIADALGLGPGVGHKAALDDASSSVVDVDAERDRLANVLLARGHRLGRQLAALRLVVFVATCSGSAVLIGGVVVAFGQVDLHAGALGADEDAKHDAIVDLETAAHMLDELLLDDVFAKHCLFIVLVVGVGGGVFVQARLDMLDVLERALVARASRARLLLVVLGQLVLVEVDKLDDHGAAQSARQRAELAVDALLLLRLRLYYDNNKKRNRVLH